VVEYVPADEAYDGVMMGCSVRYNVVGNLIHYYKQHYIDYLYMSPAQFKTWNEDITRISKMYQETVILKKKI
jgi:hypothetical protein